MIDPVAPVINAKYGNLTSADDKTVVMTVGDTLKTVVQKEIIIKCSATGHPRPKTTWYRDGLALASGGRYTLNASMIIIKSSQPSDTGKYICKASNLAGIDEVASFMDVIGRCEAIVQTFF